MRRGSLFETKHSSTDSTDLNRFGEKVAAAYVKLIEFHRTIFCSPRGQLAFGVVLLALSGLSVLLLSLGCVCLGSMLV